MYTKHCCDIDSVETRGCCIKLQVFRGANVKLRNWRQVTVSRITSTKGRNNVPNHQREDVLKLKVDDTHGNVYSHRLSY